MRNLVDNEPLNIAHHPREYLSSKETYTLSKKNQNVHSKDVFKSNIFVTKRESVFRNPVLLHKLQAKTSNVPKHKVAKKISHSNIHKVIKEHPDNPLPQMKVTPGLGENGAPVILPKKEQILADKLFNDAAFNVYLSDRISVNRSVPDPRNPKYY